METGDQTGHPSNDIQERRPEKHYQKAQKPPRNASFQRCKNPSQVTHGKPVWGNITLKKLMGKKCEHR